MSDIRELQDAIIGTARADGNPYDGVVAPPLETHTGVVTTPKIDPEDALVIDVHIEAQYPGGNEAWRKYISREMNRYMNELQEDGQTGTCVVQFMVDREGDISDAEALTMLGTRLAALCVQAIRNGPPLDTSRVQR